MARGANQVLSDAHDEALNALRTTTVGAVSPTFSTGSSTRPSINNVSSTLLASNSDRKYALITNNNGFTAYLKLGSAAVVNQGIPLPPNTSYEITINNLWIGDIRAIKSTATSANLDVFEGT